jgi:ABC-type lipoprotein release transport system permease subunit
MRWASLCLRNLWYHARGNFAVFLGVVVGTTVLTGALLVGDSLRGSLTDLAEQRLEDVTDALIAPGFFREGLGTGLFPPDRVDYTRSWFAFPENPAPLAKGIRPAILVQGTVAAGPHHARGVTILGVGSDFWKGKNAEAFGARGEGDEVWLNSTLARDLDVHAGMRVTLRLPKPAALPRETLLADRDDRAIVDEWPLRVERVLTPDAYRDRFSLRPQIEAPRTVFIPLATFQKRLGLEGRCNVLLASDLHADAQEILRKRLDLEDWGLVLRGPNERVAELFRKLDRDRDRKLQPREWRGKMADALVHAIDPAPAPTLSVETVKQFYRQQHGYLTLESRNVLIPSTITEKVKAAAAKSGLRCAPTLVYLANTIAAGDEKIPYSVVAALDRNLPPPLGPFLPPGVTSLGNDDIVLADWKDASLPRKIGEPVTLSYFPPDDHGERHEEHHRFRLAGFVPLAGVGGDPDLTPEFPGITDTQTIEEWGPSFIEKRRIKARDDAYWKEYRTTPKAYISLEKGQELWPSRFGEVTSFRLAPLQGNDLASADRKFHEELRAALAADDTTFKFQPVKKQALSASAGSGDFGGLFLAFSSFLIAAALLLVGLLFRLNLERRATEVGLLAAVGYRRRALRRLLLAEGAAVALLGTVVGTVVAIAYADLPLRLLQALWPGGALRTILQPHVSPVSLTIGAAASFLVCVLTIAWGVWAMGRVPPRVLLAGQGHVEKITTPGQRRWGWWVVLGAVIGSVALLAISGSVHDPEMRAMTFFSSGSLLLTACLVAVATWMRGSRHRTVTGHGWWSITRLGVRNAARYPTRSLLTCGLLASAAFLLVAVEAFRRRADIDVYDINGPSGGFSLIGESDLPLYLDLNSDEGRNQVRQRLELLYQDQPQGKKTASERADDAEALLKQTQLFAFRVHTGDDASCLNLYKPTQPRLLGVPKALIDRGGFSFAERGPGPANPWELLGGIRKEGIYGFGEKNTVQWILKGDLGQAIALPSYGFDLWIAGLLQDSVFQSSLLISEEHFLEKFPRHEGYSFFLIQPPRGGEMEVKRLLDAGLADRGFEATPVVDRLEAYLAVENMYLSTFQALGGLGLVLGSLGLAVVLLRGVWERRSELALLRALGYRRRTIGWLVLAENAFLLLLGLAAGTLSALAAVAPHLLGSAVPWRQLLAMLGGVIVVGLVAGALATMSTLRAPLVPALRRE